LPDIDSLVKLLGKAGSDASEQFIISNILNESGNVGNVVIGLNCTYNEYKESGKAGNALTLPLKILKFRNEVGSAPCKVENIEPLTLIALRPLGNNGIFELPFDMDNTFNPRGTAGNVVSAAQSICNSSMALKYSMPERLTMLLLVIV
jgi:hypothetical protein